MNHVIAYLMALLTVAAAAGGEGSSAVEAVRKATERYHDLQVARSEGWMLALTPCMESPEGGMGYHYGNQRLLSDGGQLDPLFPEALMYEPREDGSMQFVGVEYLLPFADWQGDEAPVFMDREMIPNEKFGVWTLHLWLKDNPNGTFAGWNPAVTCDFDQVAAR